ncbi:hypothetical protein [Pseudonocardia lacus]|uniref:hypothetical protein n=1 Tax=Pseudonocardia lacus TaxID=2835865 RepID=UPI001BDD4390|nr:hypothetical protein [Pseudonocardia lacus]
MRFTGKDVAATVLVAAIVVPYVGYLLGWDVPLVQDPRGMGAIGLVLGMLAALLAGRAAFDAEPWHRTALVTGVGAFGLGVAAVWTENEYVLAVFVIAIVATWALATLVDTAVLPPTRTAGRAHGHV